MRAASAHHEGYVWPTDEPCDKAQCNEPEPRGHDPPKPDPSISACIFRGLVEQVVHICLTKLPTHCQWKGQKDSPPAKAEPGDPVLLLPRQKRCEQTNTSDTQATILNRKAGLDLIQVIDVYVC